MIPELLPREGEAQLRTKDDGLRLVVFSADVYQADPDSPTSYVISATDVTAAREHAGMVEHLLRSARTIAFVGTDLLGRITLFNTGAEHMLGVATELATGRELVEFIAPEDLERYSQDGGAAFDAIVEHAADELTPETRDWTWLPSGRAPIKVSMTTNPVTDTFGHVIGYLFVATDITDTRRSQEILVKALRREREVVARLKDLDRAKDDFVSTVSHELRTPMSSIIGSAEMLGEGVLGDLAPRAAADDQRHLPQRRPAAGPRRRPAACWPPSTTTPGRTSTARSTCGPWCRRASTPIAAMLATRRARGHLRDAGRTP